jgi:hypothetical protein
VLGEEVVDGNDVVGLAACRGGGDRAWRGHARIGVRFFGLLPLFHQCLLFEAYKYILKHITFLIKINICTEHFILSHASPRAATERVARACLPSYLRV